MKPFWLLPLAAFPLMLLASCGDTETKEEVPESRADATKEPAKPNEKGIDEAIAVGDIEAVRGLIAADPECVHQSKNPSLSPLQQAVMRNKTEIALLLLESGAKTDQVDASKRSLVHLAVERGNAALIPVLIKHEADPNLLDKDGWTPLHHAAAKDKVEVARALLEGGANPKVRSARGGTPLHEGAASGSREMIELLLEFKIDPKVVSTTGVTALDVAREQKNEAAIKILSAEAE